MFDYLYLLHDSIDKNNNVLKIGKTIQSPEKRFQGYGINSKPLIIYAVDDCHLRETELKKLFNSKFKLFRGKEYFQGNIKDMLVVFEKFCSQNIIKDNICNKIIDGIKTQTNALKLNSVIPDYVYEITKKINENEEEFKEDIEINISKKFIDDFLDITKEQSIDNKFNINFDKVCSWLDIRKDNLKKILISKFEDNIDYIIYKIKNTNRSTGAAISELIMITLNCFKELCMISKTPKAKEARKCILSI
jgi:phage anti-repressor protein